MPRKASRIKRVVATKKRPPLYDRVAALFDERVRPFLAMHGGDAQVAGIEDGMVRVRLYGACQGCGMAAMTFKLGVEKLLIEKFPNEVEGLEYE